MTTRHEPETQEGTFPEAGRVMPHLSVVVPIYDEEENLELLHGEIQAALDELPFASEVLYVDDGSRDRTPRILTSLHERDTRVRVIRFRRNFGQTPALAAGFDHARGNVVVTMDGDLQNDPADIPRLLEKLEQGYDIVAGWRKNRQDRWLSRRLPSMIANRMMASLSGVNIHDSGCTLKVFRRRVVKNLRLYAELHRFIPAMARTTGARVCELVVNHRERRFGKSKYGIMRTIRVLFDLMTVKMLVQFASRPLHWFAFLALPFLFLTAAFLVLGLVQFGAQGEWQIVGVDDFQITFPAIGLLFSILAVELVMLGMLGELIVKTSGVHRRVILESIVSEVR
ncbi:MAG: glycosyltransferase family 2 protein [Planctomycetes bacterium]|nr:glycosyltransferase family 2 protein [Planctomycetota bacterium]